MSRERETVRNIGDVDKEQTIEFVAPVTGPCRICDPSDTMPLRDTVHDAQVKAGQRFIWTVPPGTWELRMRAARTEDDAQVRLRDGAEVTQRDVTPEDTTRTR